MARTLFDVDDAPEATPAAATPCVRTRPRLRRDAIVPVRLTEGERDQLAEVARDLGISISTYIRQAALSRPLQPTVVSGAGTHLFDDQPSPLPRLLRRR